MRITEITTLGELIKSGYQYKSIKDELRQNLIQKLKNKETIFEGIYGYEDTVIPDLERAILSKHNINLLGLRGQAKTRIARLMVKLLDEYVPIVAGAELNDDPLKPISRYAIDLIAAHGDSTPIAWLHRNERYAEKLATPDVSVADLIGDVDPIKAANMRLSYADDRVIHFGIIPRSNRCIFVINELPDLQARIQVALFNILQEGDIQIRGFKLRLPLDIQFVFTANPEDYTNRGSIVTPLKDRIGSQILTHYPKDVKMASIITKQEAEKSNSEANIEVPEIAAELLEQVGFEARASEYIDSKSGVSARLSISAYENLISAAERRCILNGDTKTTVRITDFNGIIPAITGKVELVYEGEQEGAWIVANHLISKALRTTFPKYFPSPEKTKKKEAVDQVYTPILEWFSEGNSIDLFFEMSNTAYQKSLDEVKGLKAVVKQLYPRATASELYFLMELTLHALSEYSKLSKGALLRGNRFGDMFNAVFGSSNA
jgi:magnesium chelatase subunit I